MAKALTDVAIRNLKPSTQRREVPDPGARGLYVVVQPTGQKSFAVRYRFAGKSRKLTLTAGISLAAARKECADALYQIERGHDPGEAKRESRQEQRRAAENTFRAITDEYMRREGDRLRSARDRRSALGRLIFPALGHRPIGAIKRSEIIRLLDQIEDDKGPGMARTTLAIIRAIMNWHATRTDDFRTPIVRGMDRNKPNARDRILTDNEIRAIWQAAQGSLFGSLVKFLLLTAARRNEAAHLTWNEIQGADWTLPAARNKTNKDLIRPLSGAAQSLLDELPKNGAHIFSFNGRNSLGGLSRLKAAFDEASGTSGWTIHDLRRTARSLLSRAGVPTDHAERCLGHVLGGVRGVYDRHEYHREKQLAFEALAAQIERIVNPQPNVLPMRG
jgi:integrase